MFTPAGHSPAHLKSEELALSFECLETPDIVNLGGLYLAFFFFRTDLVSFGGKW